MADMTPGFKTSEFWKSAVVTLVGLLAASGVFPDDSQFLKIAGLIAAALSSGAYSLSRGNTKSASGGFVDASYLRVLGLLAVLGLVILGLVGCSSIPQSHIDADVAEFQTIVRPYAAYVASGRNPDGTPISPEMLAAIKRNVHAQGAGIAQLTGVTPTATALGD